MSWDNFEIQEYFDIRERARAASIDMFRIRMLYLDTGTEGAIGDLGVRMFYGPNAARNAARDRNENR